MPEKMPVEKPTTTMPPQGRTEASGPGAETCGEGCGSITTKPLVSKKPNTMTTTKFEKTKVPYEKDFTTSHREADIRGEPCSPHKTTQRITPGEAEARRRERVSMRDCGPIQRGRPCAADCLVMNVASVLTGGDLGRTSGRSAWAFGVTGSEWEVPPRLSALRGDVLKSVRCDGAHIGHHVVMRVLPDLRVTMADSSLWLR